MGLTLVFFGLTGHADNIAKVDGVVVAVEDEDAVRCGRVIVATQVLQEETAQGGRGTFVVADDHTLGGDSAGDGGGRSAALDVIDGGIGRQAGVAGAVTGGKVDRHVVGRVIVVLIGNLAGQDG